MKNWESFCEQFLAIRGSRNYSREIKSLMKTMNRDKSGLKPDDYQWFLGALLDEKRKWFVIFFLGEVIRGMPKKLYQPLIKAAVLEESSSQNRKFIELCLKTYGHREVYDTLLEYVKNGSNEEKKGAVRALYWAKPKLVFEKNAKDHSFKNATPESKKLYNSVRGLEIRKNNILLRAFIENEDTDVRRALIPALKLRVEYAPEEAKPLVEKVIEIARASDDKFIKERVEIQTGNEKFSKPLATTAKE
jgi:hypothetical protein